MISSLGHRNGGGLLRLLKPFTIGRLKTTSVGEFYNVLNMTSVVSVSESYSTGNPPDLSTSS